VKYDRVSFTWVSDEEMARRDAEREERAFQRRANQGELCTPMIIGDSMKPTQSMGNGKVYDSKSAMRAHYKRDGWEEVGNDVPKTRFIDGERVRKDPYLTKRAHEAAFGKAEAAVNTMSDETIKRRAWERAQPKPL
jgi:hypothetical protein